ncbi:hypothetical protein NtB2_01284 [Lactococcus termiticola]|uniref:Uncharacterized protein n=1 Tax=Lactococcus termiticola TaxID=2169526 RepID=A0A2R5HGG2_9LACT|nr:hypothetical protein NtB2_01284 [Lactococcus termiticola]
MFRGTIFGPNNQNEVADKENAIFLLRVVLGAKKGPGELFCLNTQILRQVLA